MASSPNALAVAYRERQWPSRGAWLLAPMGAVLIALAVWPLSSRGATAIGIVVAATLCLLLARTADPVAVVAAPRPGLQAGRAFLPAAAIGRVAALDVEATRHVLGPGADARAHLAHRGWIRTAVRVDVVDPRDPTPYWVVSTRRPADLASAILTLQDQAAHSEHTRPSASE